LATPVGDFLEMDVDLVFDFYQAAIDLNKRETNIGE